MWNSPKTNHLFKACGRVLCMCDSIVNQKLAEGILKGLQQCNWNKRNLHPSTDAKIVVAITSCKPIFQSFNFRRRWFSLPITSIADHNEANDSKKKESTLTCLPESHSLENVEMYLLWVLLLRFNRTDDYKTLCRSAFTFQFSST